MEILGLIDKLEAMATSAKKFPLGRKALVDSDQILELVDQLRVAVPRDIAEAEKVIKKRDDLMNQSMGEARRIRANAENEYRSRVDDSELLKEGKKRAEKMIEEAQQKAQHLLDLADRDAAGRLEAANQYSQEVLYKLEQEVANLLSTVRRGIEVLESHQSAAAR